MLIVLIVLIGYLEKVTPVSSETPGRKGGPRRVVAPVLTM